MCGPVFQCFSASFGERAWSVGRGHVLREVAVACVGGQRGRAVAEDAGRFWTSCGSLAFPSVSFPLVDLSIGVSLPVFQVFPVSLVKDFAMSMEVFVVLLEVNNWRDGVAGAWRSLLCQSADCPSSILYAVTVLDI